MAAISNGEARNAASRARKGSIAIRISMTSIGLVARTRFSPLWPTSGLRLASAGAISPLARSACSARRKLVTFDVERLGHGALRAKLLPRRHGANGDDDLPGDPADRP